MVPLEALTDPKKRQKIGADSSARRPISCPLTICVPKCVPGTKEAAHLQAFPESG
jgi:hypothetical protein